LYDQELRINIEIPGTRKEITPHVVRFTRLGGGMNFIEYAWLMNADIDQVIRDQVDYFLPLGQPFEWNLCGHDQPGDLPSRLERQSFAPQDDPGSVMVLDLYQAPEILRNPGQVDVQRLSRRTELADVVQIVESVWGGSYDWIHKRMGDHMQIPGYLSVYIAYCDGTPARTAWTYFPNNSTFASLFGGSTLSNFRDRGLYKAVLAARVQEAIQRDRRFIIVDSNSNSRPIVERHGFRLLTTSFSYQYSG